MDGEAEEQSGSVLFTYFQGDISSMVDAHFSRALSQTNKPKGDSAKSKRHRKSIKSEEAVSGHWGLQSPSWFESTLPPVSSRRVQLGTADDSRADPPPSLHPAGDTPTLWSSNRRQGGSLGLPPMYSPAASAEGMAMAGRQYTNSLLNLLHSERPELASVMVSASKQELIPSWTTHPGFRDQMNADVSLDSGIQVMEKKDLYWY